MAPWETESEDEESSDEYFQVNDANDDAEDYEDYDEDVTTSRPQKQLKKRLDDKGKNRVNVIFYYYIMCSFVRSKVHWMFL